MATIDADPHPVRGTRRRLLRATPLLVVFVFAFVAGACASAAMPAVPAPQARNAAGGGTSSEAQPPSDLVEGGVPVPAASAGPAGDQTGGGGGQDAVEAAIAAGTYIVKTGSLTVEVKALDPALLSARTAITGLGGYISGSQQSGTGDQPMASVTYRFPADRWEDALDAIRGLSTKVIDLRTSTDEVTGQVVDLGARIDNLRATEAALQAIMAKAVKIQDILDVQNQLTDVQGQIEELTAQQTHLKDQASMSTLAVTYQLPPVPVAKETAKGWDAGAELDRAAASLIGLAQGLATVGIWFAVVVLPVLVLVVIAVLLLGLIVRRIVPARPVGPPALSGGPEA